MKEVETEIDNSGTETVYLAKNIFSLFLISQ